MPGICIDLRHIAARAEITPDDLAAAVRQCGHAVPKGGTVLLCTGHHERTFPRKEYASENSGVNVAATEWLAQQGIVRRSWGIARTRLDKTASQACVW